MIDPISSSTIRPRTARPGEDAGVTVQGSAVGGASSAVPTAAGDSVTLSAAAATLPEELRSGPTIDKAVVGEIKDAIAQGRYQVDLEAITERLFENYLEQVS